MRSIPLSTLLFISTYTLGVHSRYFGGVALRVPDQCPDGTQEGHLTFQLNCCPANTVYFDVEGETPVCCPDQEDCYDEVIRHLACPDRSWTLCEPSFCCQKGYTCFSEADGVGCLAPGDQLAASQTALKTLIPAGEGPRTRTDLPTTSTSSTSTTAATKAAATSSSSLPTPEESGDSPNIGAIVGGVLGGIAIVAAAVLLGVWMCLRTRRKRANKDEPTTDETQSAFNQNGYNSAYSPAPAYGQPPSGNYQPSAEIYKYHQSPATPMSEMPSDGPQKRHAPAEFHEAYAPMKPINRSPAELPQ